MKCTVFSTREARVIVFPMLK